DFLPSAYLVGTISIVVSRHNQRLGDLAAGTLVVRERDARPRAADWAAWSRPTVPLDAVVGWDASAVTPAEVAAVRTFLDRPVTFSTRCASIRPESSSYCCHSRCSPA